MWVALVAAILFVSAAAEERHWQAVLQASFSSSSSSSSSLSLPGGAAAAAAAAAAAQQLVLLTATRSASTSMANAVAEHGAKASPCCEGIPVLRRHPYLPAGPPVMPAHAMNRVNLLITGCAISFNEFFDSDDDIGVPHGAEAKDFDTIDAVMPCQYATTLTQRAFPCNSHFAPLHSVLCTLHSLPAMHCARRHCACLQVRERRLRRQCVGRPPAQHVGRPRRGARRILRPLAPERARSDPSGGLRLPVRRHSQNPRGDERVRPRVWAGEPASGRDRGRLRRAREPAAAAQQLGHARGGHRAPRRRRARVQRQLFECASPRLNSNRATQRTPHTAHALHCLPPSTSRNLHSPPAMRRAAGATSQWHSSNDPGEADDDPRKQAWMAANCTSVASEPFQAAHDAW